MTAKKRILIFLTNCGELGASHKPTGFWLSELTHFYDVMREAGFEADIASPQGGEAPIDRQQDNARCHQQKISWRSGVR